MKEQVPGNYLRAHRKKSGLSQRELGILIGYKDQGQVSRHERSESIPPLVVALAYEIVFRVPVSSIFGGIRGNVQSQLEEKLGQMETELGNRSARDRDATVVAQKLIWLCERRRE